MIRTTYQYKGEVLQAGTPRNDRLVNGDIGEMRKRVRERYDIPENGRIVLYAPTYRRTGIPVVMDSDYLLGQLDTIRNPANLLRQDDAEISETVKWYFLCRYHRYQDDSMDIRVKGKDVIDVMDYPDMQELLCAADILITDYSSCVWDYAFLKRPCFLFVPDKEAYTADTGFYVSLDEWPFAQAEDMEGLADNISSYDSEQAEQAVNAHLKQLGSYETGSCCERVAERIMKEQGG